MGEYGMSRLLVADVPNQVWRPGATPFAGSGDNEPDPDFPTERDIWLWPGHHESIWNLPIATSAIMQPANFSPGKGQWSVAWDEEILIFENKGGTPRTLWLNEAPQDGGALKVRKTQNWSATYGTITIPTGDQLVNRSVTHNGCTSIIKSDGSVYSFQPFTNEGGSDIFCSWWIPKDPSTSFFGANYGWGAESNSIYGPLRAGSHGGSSLSTLGGSLRKWEIDTVGAPIRHALKINVPGGLYLSNQNQGYRWPAYRADSGYQNEYGGSNPEIRMGSLLAIPKSTPKPSGLSDLASRVFDALQTYGTYIVDDSYYVPGSWEVFAFAAEWGARGPTNTERDQINAMMPSLHVVTNSTSSTPGGGALGSSRLAPLAPVVNP